MTSLEQLAGYATSIKNDPSLIDDKVYMVLEGSSPTCSDNSVVSMIPGRNILYSWILSKINVWLIV